MMTSAQIVKMLVTTIDNISPPEDYTYTHNENTH